MTTLMEIENLVKKIGSLHLRGINLKIEPGYIVGLVGVNGSGKTTLINTILNLYKKDSGSVKINGISMDANEKDAKDQIGFVLDENMFEDSMSVISNGKFMEVFIVSLMKIYSVNFVSVLKYLLRRK